MLARRIGAPDPLEKLRRQRAEIDQLCWPRSASAAPRAAARTSCRCCSPRASRTASDGRPGDLRPARDAAAWRAMRRPRPRSRGRSTAVHHPAALDAARRRLRRRVPEGGDRRVAAAAAGRAAAGRRLASELAGRRPALPAGTDVTPRSGSPTRARTSTRSRSRSGPSGGSTRPPPGYAWVPFGGGVRRCLGAAFARWRCGWRWRRCSRPCAQAARPRPSASRAATYVLAGARDRLVAGRREATSSCCGRRGRRRPRRRAARDRPQPQGRGFFDDPTSAGGALPAL